MYDALAFDYHWPRKTLSTAHPDETAQRRNRMAVGALLQAPLEALRPTQMAVGMRSVTRKQRKVENRAGKRKKIEKLLCKRPIPAVRGPDGALFIVDHHHFGLALCLAQVKTAYVHVIDDISQLSRHAFWQRMEAEGRLYPYDEFGRRIPPSLLPTSLHALRHDPFRDLAWEVREAEGFDKAPEPYAEFHWANFFREQIPSRRSAAIPRRPFVSPSSSAGPRMPQNFPDTPTDPGREQRLNAPA